MSATLTPPPPTRVTPADGTQPAAPPAVPRPILRALAVLVGIGAIALGIALISGATLVFNILVFALFTVLWIAVAAALVLRPRALDEFWYGVRRLPLVVQAVIWLLLLPIMIGLWIWERTWSLPVRLTLVLAIGAWNIFMFFPRP
jgi:hypothetical protein